MNDSKNKLQQKRNIWGARANGAIQVLIVLALVITVNYLAYRHPDAFVPTNWFSKEKKVRWDIKQGFKYELSGQTKSILESLNEPVEVYVVFSPSSDIYQRVISLLREYERYSKNLKVTIIDKDRDFSRVRELSSKYRFSDQENLVVFVCGARHKILDGYDLAEYESSGMSFGQNPDMRLTSFKAEQRFTSALKVVADEKQSIVYYLLGHGEPPLAGDKPDQYGGLAVAIERENIGILPLENLSTEAQIPADADLLMILDPKSEFLPQEIQAIEEYLAAQGKLFVAIAPRVKTGLEPLLAKYGVKLQNDVIIGYINVMGIPALSESAVVQARQGHPVTDVISKQNINLVFPSARSIDLQAPSADINPPPDYTALATTFKGFWGEMGALEEGAKFDEKTDLPGPLVTALAIEVGRLDSKEVAVNTTKIIVVGSAQFAANSSLSHNYDFMLNSLNWLLSRDQMIGIAPKPIEQFSLNLSANQLNTLVIIILLGLPGVIAVIGLMVWFKRRK